MSEVIVILRTDGSVTSAGELREFIDRVAGLEGFPSNFLVEVRPAVDWEGSYELRASTDFRRP